MPPRPAVRRWTWLAARLHARCSRRAPPPRPVPRAPPCHRRCRRRLPRGQARPPGPARGLALAGILPTPGNRAGRSRQDLALHSCRGARRPLGASPAQQAARPTASPHQPKSPAALPTTTRVRQRARLKVACGSESLRRGALRLQGRPPPCRGAGSPAPAAPQEGGVGTAAASRRRRAGGKAPAAAWHGGTLAAMVMIRARLLVQGPRVWAAGLGHTRACRCPTGRLMTAGRCCPLGAWALSNPGSRSSNCQWQPQQQQRHQLTGLHRHTRRRCLLRAGCRPRGPRPWSWRSSIWRPPWTRPRPSRVAPPGSAAAAAGRRAPCRCPTLHVATPAARVAAPWGSRGGPSCPARAPRLPPGRPGLRARGGTSRRRCGSTACRSRYTPAAMLHHLGRL